MLRRRLSSEPMTEPLTQVGEANGNHKLTEEQALLVFRLASEGHYSQRKLAAMFGVSQGAVSDIKHGRTWRHLTEEVA